MDNNFHLIIEEVLPLIKKTFARKVESLLLNEFEKKLLNDENRYGFQNFKDIAYEAMHEKILKIESEKTSIIDESVIIFKTYLNLGLDEDIFLNKSLYDFFLYEISCYFWWKIQFSVNSEFIPISKDFDSYKHFLDSIYPYFYSFVVEHKYYDSIEPLKEKYCLSALLEFFSIEDYFSNLYVSTYKLDLDEKKASTNSLQYEVVYSEFKDYYILLSKIMKVMPFNRCTKLSGHMYATGNLSSDTKILSFHIPLENDSSLIAMFEHLLTSLTSSLLFILSERVKDPNTPENIDFKKIKSLINKINEASQLANAFSTVQKNEKKSNFLNKRASLLTGMNVLMYRFYEEHNETKSYNDYLKYIQKLFQKEGYIAKESFKGTTDQKHIKVELPSSKVDKEFIISIGTLRSALQDFEENMIRYNNLG